MSPEHRRHSVVALLVLLLIGCAMLAHYAIAVAKSPTLGALLSLVPVSGVGVAAASRARHRAPVLLAMASAAVAVWLGWSLLEANFTHLFFLEHAGANLILGLIFGRTLVGNSEPLCTRFARLIHGSLLPDVALYTRRVTLAWTIFFFMLFAVSCALYLGGFLEAWSILANIVSPLLVVTMFAAEYAMRLRALPNQTRVGILVGVRAFRHHFKAAPVEAPR
ncbi:MAG: hypothetical protein ABJC33_10600 [Betaproteobacteria bacterium]